MCEAAAAAGKGAGRSAVAGVAISTMRATRSEQFTSSQSPLRLSVSCVILGAPVICTPSKTDTLLRILRLRAEILA